MIQFFADESVDHRIVIFLRENGISISSVQELMKGVKDEIVLSTAWKENRILITEDKDFGELTIRLGKQNYGVILLRFPGIEIEKKTTNSKTAPPVF